MKTRYRVAALGIVILLGAGIAVAYPEPPDPAETAPTLEPVYAPPAEVLTTRQVRYGETLSEVFARADLPSSELSGLALAAQELINPRRVRPNTLVVVRRWAETGAPRAVEVTLNADTTLRLNPSEIGWLGELRLTPVAVDTLAISGRLGPGGSLYTAVVNHPGLSHVPFREREALVWRLATNVYGWQLDFSHDARPGDTYRVVYEREARPDGSSRSARVLVAEIVNQGDTIPAVYFEPTVGNGDYYDRDGESLRMAFLRYPVDYPRITSNFSWRRYHPILKRNRPHLGTDFGTGRGAPVHSTADGVIRFAGWDGGYGNLVRIYHGNGYETRYAHLSRFAPGIRQGVHVRQGQLIGYSGDTGLATAPHLHYEMRQNGQPRDPRTVRLPAAPAVPAERMEAFEQLLAERSQLLPAYPAAPEPDSVAAR